MQQKDIAVLAARYADEKKAENVKLLAHDGNVFGIEPPLFVELEITDTEPGFAGNTAQGRDAQK